jgi:hypothetical protein
MVITESIRLRAKQTTMIISVHTVLLVICSFAHEKIDLFYAMTAYAPILLLFGLAPLAAVYFLSTQSARQSAVVLLGILLAVLFYNITSRFTVPPPMTPQEPAFIWKILYEGSFGLVLVFEAIAFWLTFNLLREIHKQINQQTKNTQDNSKNQ